MGVWVCVWLYVCLSRVSPPFFLMGGGHVHTENRRHGSYEKRKNLSFLSLRKSLSFLATAVNIFDSDFEMAKRTRQPGPPPFFGPLPSLLGISNDFGSDPKLIECLCFIKFDFSSHLQPDCPTKLDKCRPTFVAMIYVSWILNNRLRSGTGRA